MRSCHCGETRKQRWAVLTRKWTLTSASPVWVPSSLVSTDFLLSYRPSFSLDFCSGNLYERNVYTRWWYNTQFYLDVSNWGWNNKLSLIFTIISNVASVVSVSAVSSCFSGGWEMVSRRLVSCLVVDHLIQLWPQDQRWFYYGVIDGQYAGRKSAGQIALYIACGHFTRLTWPGKYMTDTQPTAYTYMYSRSQLPLTDMFGRSMTSAMNRSSSPIVCLYGW